MKTGVVEPEKRGGRHSSMVENDKEQTELILNHINKFSRVESHYVRAETSREYLHEDLNLARMYRMFCAEHKGRKIPSMVKYSNVFHRLNLSFHRPKKDKCSLCSMYREGDSSVKEKLQKQYQEHINEKQRVRQLKDDCKNNAIGNKSHSVAVFDLQQVIYLPKSNEGAIFYKRRLAVYNFTIYTLENKQCSCFTWHEAISKRGSAEISSCLFKYLENCANQGVKKVSLFSDGCFGQNKNTIVVAMLIYVVVKTNIEEITLRFFEPNHGQSEGDSAHSAIGYAIKHAGDLFVPSQLVPVMKLARSSNPYEVIQMESSDFLDFKTFSKDLRILQVRKDNQDGSSINWTDVVEIGVRKTKPNEIFFKTSHLQERERSITLKRLNDDPFEKPLGHLNNVQPKISADKFKDLMSLCEGDIPVIRNSEFINFYKSLPHL